MMKFFKELKFLVLVIVLLLGVVGWGIWLERSVAMKKDLVINQIAAEKALTESQIVQMEVNKVLLLAPHGGKLENAPANVVTVHGMLDLLSIKYRGGK